MFTSNDQMMGDKSLQDHYEVHHSDRESAREAMCALCSRLHSEVHQSSLSLFSFELGLTFTLNYQVLTTTANAGGEAKGLHRLRRLVGGGREMSEKRIFFLVTDKVGILILIGVVAVDFWTEG